MNLRTKTLLLIMGPVLVLFAVLYWSAQSIVLQSFGILERQQAHRNLHRALDAIENDKKALSQAVSDWAIWDDSYQFVQGQNQEFARGNLTAQAYKNLDLNLMAFIDLAGRLTFGKMIYTNPDSLEPACSCLIAHLQDSSDLITKSRADTLVSGLVITDDGPMLFAAHVIFHSDFSGPPQGTLVFGRLLDDDEFAYYSEITHVVIQAFQLDAQDNPQDVREARPQLVGSDPWSFHAYDSDAAAGYYLLKDYLGQPALILRTNFPRELMTEAVKTARILLYMLLGASLLFALLLLILLQRGLVSRLTGLNQTVAEIAAAGDLSVRVPVQGRDEVAGLAGQINEMLVTIENSAQEQKTHAEHLEKLFEEVKINENMLRNLFDFSPDGIAIANLDGVFMSCNQAALSLHGFTERSEIVGRNLIDVLAPKERSRALLILREIAQRGSLKNFETLCVRKNGKIFESEISLGVVKGAEDQPACLVTILRDISERKQAEKVLTLSEQRYRLLFERSLAGVYRTSLDGRILEINNTMMRILGFTSKEEMTQCRVQDFYEEAEDREKFLSILWEKGSISNYQHELLRGDGSKAWVLENATMLIGETNEPLIIQGTIIDITDLKTVEHELRQSEARYRRLLADNPAGIFRFSFDPITFKLQRLDCNEAHARILGYSSREELMSVDAEASLGSPSNFAEQLGRLVDGKSLAHYEMPLIRKDGSAVWVLLNATYSPGENGGPGLIEGAMTDITEWKKTREQNFAREIKEIEEKMRSTMGLMVAGLAHNLNSPLQGIINSVELLQLMQGDLPHLDDILQQSQRLSSMINSILSKTRQEQDQDVQEIDLNNLLIQELDFYNSDMVFKHDIEKRYNFDSNLRTVRGVYCEFSQAFMNIIKNALDAMHGRDQKRLHVTTKAQADGGIVVEIGDSGSGIAPEHLNRIFDPFFTTKPLAGRQSNGEPTGTGLGLSSVKQILGKYQANIQVDSTPGQGTTIIIYIPAQQTTESNYSHINNLTNSERRLPK